MARPRKLSPEILEAALNGLQAQLERLDSQIADVRQLLGPDQPRHKRSAAVRRKMAAAQRRRWAALKAAPEAPKPKRRLSAAGRKAIIEATKKRWAEFRKRAAK